MAYQVVLAGTARADANQIYDWVVERAPIRGQEWFEELVDCLYSLEQLPYRCPLAREAEARREIRCLLFGNRKHAYRVLYEVDEAAKQSGFCISGTERFGTSLPTNLATRARSDLIWRRGMRHEAAVRHVGWSRQV